MSSLNVSSRTAQSRHFAIVPAAGHSRRMGQPKLLLDWRGQTIMDQVLGAWTASHASCVMVVIRRHDAALLDVCRRWPVEVVQPASDPVDMKESLQVGLRYAAQAHQANDADRWLFAPADLPGLNAPLINQLIAAGNSRTSIIAPRFGGRQGHPVSVPWSLTPEVFALATDEGMDRIIARHAAWHIDLPARDGLTDVDTPDDYRELLNE